MPDEKDKPETEAGAPKKPYTSPALTEYGNINELTKGTGLLITDGALVTGSVVSTVVVIG